MVGAPEWYAWLKAEGLAQLRELVMALWDPIGVAGAPEASDEYDDYLLQIAAGLRRGDSPETVAGYLGRVRTEDMSLMPQPELDARAARALVEWHAASSPSGRLAPRVPRCPLCGQKFTRIDTYRAGARRCGQRGFCPRGHGPYFKWLGSDEPWQLAREAGFSTAGD